MIETYNGHYEYLDPGPQDGWCHLRVYEERDAPAVVIAVPCPNSRGRALAENDGGLAARVFAHLIPYARDSFRWFERSDVAPEQDGSGDAQFIEISFSPYNSSGGWLFTARKRIPTERTAIEALIGRPLAPVACTESGTPPRRLRTVKSVIDEDDPWYLPPDTPIPVTWQLPHGQTARSIPKVERAHRKKLLEEKALERRRGMLGY